jgi:hypothetical protein
MPIEFRCPACQQQLRVPDESAGKNAKCPKCGTIAAIPSANLAAGAPPPPSLPPPLVSPPASPFGDAEQPGRNPFAEKSPPPPSLNPYASPADSFAPKIAAAGAFPSQPVTNQRVEIGQIWNYAWQVWQTNLGLLVGVTLTVIAISYAFSIPITIFQLVLEQRDEKELAAVVVFLGNIVSFVVQTFVGIGHAIIALKLARQQPTSFGELFSGGRRFLPVLLATILFMIALIAGAFACVVPAIFLGIFFWPYYFLIVEEKAAVIESFSLAYQVTEGNRLTTFLLALLSIAVMLIGFFAFCIGIIFAAPLVTMLWVCAYLMMSGQIPVQQMPAPFPGYGPAPLSPGK